MRKFSFQISKYVLQAVLPYFFLIWLLLSVILFVQQAGRYSELLFNTTLPGSLIAQLTIALIPNVIAFTCPVAVLVGVIIGLSRMQGDSEMVALRSAGVGNLQIATSIIVLGLLLSFFAIFINLKGVPFAAQIVRQVALKAALYKLESPIEPGTFNSEISNFTIYVEKGNLEKGIWENIFIYQKDPTNKQMRLITSKEGKVDSSDEDSEIFLKNAKVITFDDNDNNKIISETVDDFRLTAQTKRGEIIEKLAKLKETPEEMGLVELARYINSSEGIEKTEAHILWQRRILLSITPLLFALLGTALVIKFNRGGRGFGVFLSLISLIFYYLLTLLGEQLARTGTIEVFTAGLIPIVAIILLITWLFVSRRYVITRNISIDNIISWKPKDKVDKSSKQTQSIRFTTGILDLDIVLSLLKFYLLTIGFLTTIYLIFTAFELWKFAGTFENGVHLLIKYLFFLIPFVYIQISPSALMIATLATYVIKSRQNEIVTWTAAGQSVYRLLLPCFLLMIVIGGINFIFQEIVIYKTNQIQDQLRSNIRNRNQIQENSGVFWVAKDNKIINFEKPIASDNDKIVNIQIIEFSEDREVIESYIKIPELVKRGNKYEQEKVAEKITWRDNSFLINKINENPLEISTELLFDKKLTKPSHLNIFQTKEKIELSNSVSEKRTYNLALQKKYTTLFIPLIIILFTAPFALSLGRKGNVITIAYAVGVWLVFMGTINIFEQFGQSGYLSPIYAIWSPLMLFTIIGLFLISRIKT